MKVVSIDSNIKPRHLHLGLCAMRDQTWDDWLYRNERFDEFWLMLRPTDATQRQLLLATYLRGVQQELINSYKWTSPKPAGLLINSYINTAWAHVNNSESSQDANFQALIDLAVERYVPDLNIIILAPNDHRYVYQNAEQISSILVKRAAAYPEKYFTIQLDPVQHAACFLEMADVDCCKEATVGWNEIGKSLLEKCNQVIPNLFRTSFFSSGSSGDDLF